MSTNESELALLQEQVEISEQLWAGRETMFQPQDLPGRYGRIVASLDRILGHGLPKCFGGRVGRVAAWLSWTNDAGSRHCITRGAH